MDVRSLSALLTDIGLLEASRSEKTQKDVVGKYQTHLTSDHTDVIHSSEIIVQDEG